MTKRTIFRIAVLVLLVAAFVAIWFSPLRAQLTRDHIRVFVEHLRGLWYGPIAFILAFAVGCVFAIPASLFVVAAGFIWGWVFGTIYSIIGATLGAVASFYVGRFLGTGVLDRFGRVGRMVAKQVDHAGFKSLLILRNIPGIPFAVLNYGAGVAGVRMRDFLPSTLIGITPSLLVFTYCADAVFNGSMSEGEVVTRLLIVCGLMLTIMLLPMLVKRLTKRSATASDLVQ
ncbi:MAG: hypothetical protein DMF56_10155 [Acidobacteria bacterium]|nr:MAG: hypothetical protein DMF56_10155 [Acidobacteriota bacterium]